MSLVTCCECGSTIRDGGHCDECVTIVTEERDTFQDELAKVREELSRRCGCWRDVIRAKAKAAGRAKTIRRLVEENAKLESARDDFAEWLMEYEKDYEKLEAENAALRADLAQAREERLAMLKNPAEFMHELICSKRHGRRSGCAVCRNQPNPVDRLMAERDAAIQRAEAAERETATWKSLVAERDTEIDRILKRHHEERLAGGDQMGDLRRRAEAAEAIVAKLTKTEDGVPITHQMILWGFDGEDETLYYWRANQYYGAGCYSTEQTAREAAERAGRKT